MAYQNFSWEMCHTRFFPVLCVNFYHILTLRVIDQISTANQRKWIMRFSIETNWKWLSFSHFKLCVSGNVITNRQKSHMLIFIAAKFRRQDEKYVKNSNGSVCFFLPSFYLYTENLTSMRQRTLACMSHQCNLKKLCSFVVCKQRHEKKNTRNR